MAKNILITDNLYNDILSFCKVNNIEDINQYCAYLLDKAMLAEKYGPAPTVITNKIENTKSVDSIKKQEETVVIKNKQNIDDYGVYDY